MAKRSVMTKYVTESVTAWTTVMNRVAKAEEQPKPTLSWSFSPTFSWVVSFLVPFYSTYIGSKIYPIPNPPQASLQTPHLYQIPNPLQASLRTPHLVTTSPMNTYRRTLFKFSWSKGHFCQSSVRMKRPLSKTTIWTLGTGTKFTCCFPSWKPVGIQIRVGLSSNSSSLWNKSIVVAKSWSNIFGPSPCLPTTSCYFFWSGCWVNWNQDVLIWLDDSSTQTVCHYMLVGCTLRTSFFLLCWGSIKWRQSCWTCGRILCSILLCKAMQAFNL